MWSFLIRSEQPPGDVAPSRSKASGRFREQKVKITVGFLPCSSLPSHLSVHGLVNIYCSYMCECVHGVFSSSIWLLVLLVKDSRLVVCFIGLWIWSRNTETCDFAWIWSLIRIIMDQKVAGVPLCPVYRSTGVTWKEI